MNLFEPGKSPAENMQFLLFLAAMMHAVDEHQDLLRISAASAGNDHRLGASEAPPAIVSMFLGDELTAVVEAITHKEIYQAEKPYLEMGLPSLPRIRRDTTDRNRTSPFAFTGNKFEFRMVGSSFSIADANTVLNTAVADALRDFADELELADDFTLRLGKLIRREFRAHKRITHQRQQLRSRVGGGSGETRIVQLPLQCRRHRPPHRRQKCRTLRPPRRVHRRGVGLAPGDHV